MIEMLLASRSIPWFSDEPIREELFGVERLEDHARSLARAQATSARPSPAHRVSISAAATPLVNTSERSQRWRRHEARSARLCPHPPPRHVTARIQGRRQVIDQSIAMRAKQRH